MILSFKVVFDSLNTTQRRASILHKSVELIVIERPMMSTITRSKRKMKSANHFIWHVTSRVYMSISFQGNFLNNSVKHISSPNTLIEILFVNGLPQVYLSAPQKTKFRPFLYFLPAWSLYFSAPKNYPYRLWIQIKPYLHIQSCRTWLWAELEVDDGPLHLYYI